MTETDNTPTPKKRSVALPVVLVVGALGLFAGAFVFLGGADLVDSILGGGGSELVSQVPPKPTAEPAEADTGIPGVDDPVESEEPADEPVETDAADASDQNTTASTGTAKTSSGTSAKPVPASTTAKPVTSEPVADGGDTKQPETDPAPNDDTKAPNEARERMYWEQVDSQEQIGKLVAGKITSFTLAPQSSTGGEARLRVSTVGDAPISGTAVLRAYDGVWYFSSITRDGSASPGPAGRSADTSVMNTIVEQQAASQDVIKSFVDGGYRTVKVTGVTPGSGTTTIDVQLSGGSKARQAGQIICISKDISGRKHWFLTSFREL